MTTTKKDRAGYTSENASQVRIHLGETMFMEWKEEGGSGETEVGEEKEVRVFLPAKPMTKNNF